jgi:hypothetical protein
MVKRHHRGNDGKYHIGGKSFEMLIGSRAQVMHGTAYKTAGDLTAAHLMFNKHGRIVSKKKSATAKREKRLERAGYKPKKGKFVLMRKSMRNNKTHKKRRNKHHKKHHKKRRTMRRNKSGHCHNSKGRFTKC